MGKFNEKEEWNFILKEAPNAKKSTNQMKKELHFALQCVLNQSKLSEPDIKIYFKTKEKYLSL